MIALLVELPNVRTARWPIRDLWLFRRTHATSHESDACLHLCNAACTFFLEEHAETYAARCAGNALESIRWQCSRNKIQFQLTRVTVVTGKLGSHKWSIAVNKTYSRIICKKQQATRTSNPFVNTKGSTSGGETKTTVWIITVKTANIATVRPLLLAWHISEPTYHILVVQYSVGPLRSLMRFLTMLYAQRCRSHAKNIGYSCWQNRMCPRQLPAGRNMNNNIFRFAGPFVHVRSIRSVRMYAKLQCCATIVSRPNNIRINNMTIRAYYTCRNASAHPVRAVRFLSH